MLSTVGREGYRYMEEGREKGREGRAEGVSESGRRDRQRREGEERGGEARRRGEKPAICSNFNQIFTLYGLWCQFLFTDLGQIGVKA